jgi:hypothetical protein
MKPYLLGAAFLGCSMMAGQAALFTFDSNATVHAAQGTLDTDVAIGFGMLTDVFDEEFNDIGDEWTFVSSPIDPITETPSNTGYGSSTTNNALFGINEPILIIFADSFDIATFSIFLDESTMGNLFATPIEFYDANGSLITSIDTFQNVPNYEATGTGINGVKSIVLPSGAMYDNLTITGSAVPEPAAALLGGLGTLGLLIRRRRL